MKKKYIWTCDYCGKEFDNKKLCDSHEMTCDKNPKNIWERETNPFTRNSMFFCLLVVFLSYIITFFVIGSYAKNNGFEGKNILQPQKWFNLESKVIVKPSPTTYMITDVPTKIPTSRPKVQQNNLQSNVNSGNILCTGPDGKQFTTTVAECNKFNESWGKTADYIVNCNVSSNCGGGTRSMKKSECDNSTCCQIGGSWIFYYSKSKCNSDQSNQYKGNYIYPTFTPLSTLAPIPTYSVRVYATPTMTDQQAQLIIDQHNSQVQQCRSQVNSDYNQKVQNCNIQYGGSSAAEACTFAVNKERDKALSNCGQTY